MAAESVIVNPNSPYEKILSSWKEIPGILNITGKLSINPCPRFD